MSENAIRLTRIELSGFKSIEKMDLELRSINVLIGANGAGKSNLLKSFDLIRALRVGALPRDDLPRDDLRLFVLRSGGAAALLFGGPKRTPAIEVRLVLEWREQTVETFAMAAYYGPPDQLYQGPSGPDVLSMVPDGRGEEPPDSDGGAHGESRVVKRAGEVSFATHFIDRLIVYHFADTTVEAAIRRSCYVYDNQYLRADGGNLAAMLYRIRQKSTVCYSRIVDTIRQLAPWFGDFVIEPLVDDPKRLQLDWREVGSEVVFGPHILPDGALRAIALITILLGPAEDLPPLLIVDEPELGLHPSAVVAIAGLLRAAAVHCQVIVATQSPTFLDEFEPADVIVVEREGGKSTFVRQDPERLKDWLEDYSLGELWQKNVMGGGPF